MDDLSLLKKICNNERINLEDIDSDIPASICSTTIDLGLLRVYYDGINYYHCNGRIHCSVQCLRKGVRSPVCPQKPRELHP